MPRIQCDAKKCLYNNCNMCEKTKIYVGGLYAEEKNETECISFERKNLSKCNEEYGSCHDGCGCETKIACSSEKCIYNVNKECQARQVKVKGKEALTKDETCCDTFKM